MDTADVLNHLLFHKALIDEEGEDERINGYLKIIEDMEKGMIIGIKEPWERTIATVFELVMEHKFDPWDINIAEFTKMYLKHVKKEDYINFVTAGRLVLMAWSVLKLQSEKVLIQAMPPEPQDEPEDWMQSMDIYEAPEDLDFTHTVISAESPPIQEITRVQPERPVTLIELVDAFNEAMKDASRPRHHRSAKIIPPNFHVNVHKEDLNEDLELTWNRILEFNGNAIPLHNLCTNDCWDVVTVFMSVLFLTKMKKIKLWQRNFPYGEIFVKSLNGSKELPMVKLPVAGLEEDQESVEEKVVEA